LKELHSTLAVGRVIGLAREIALTHHERFDGTGYPSGLRGRNIPVAGRIVAVANSYTAMTSNRPWRVGFTHEQALAMMQAESKAAFDPEVIDALVAVVDGFRQRKAG
jgi:putative two-component system response regulator